MLAQMDAVVALEGAGGLLSWWRGDPAAREAVFAVVATALLLVAAPRGRRRTAWLSLLFLGLGAFALMAMAVLPSARDVAVGHGLGHSIVRFFALAALLQSLLLLVVVAGWERVSRPLPKIFVDILRCMLLGFTLLVVMWEAGIDARELVTGSAVITAVLGFALRDTLGNVFAGLAIHAEHPFEVGDWIQYDTNPAHIGRVVEINWRATKVITLDEATVIIPNGQLAQASIRNFTKPDPWSRRSLFVVTPYGVSPQRVQRVILDAIRGSFGVLEHPAPSVVTNAFTERGVEHWVRLFTNDFDKRDRVDGMARDRIWFALSRNGIEIPTATQAIRLTEVAPVEPPEPVETALARRVESLESVGMIHILGVEQVKRLASETRELVFAAGEPIIRQGEAGESMFVVLDGNVEVVAAENGARPAVVAHLGPGDYFGEMSLMTGAARTATVVALAETRVLEVGKESFRRVLDEQPSLVGRLSTALGQRLEERARAIERSGAAPQSPPPDLLARIRDFFAL